MKRYVQKCCHFSLLLLPFGTFDDMFSRPELLEDYKDKHGAARMWIIDENGTCLDTGEMDKNFADKRNCSLKRCREERGFRMYFWGN